MADDQINQIHREATRAIDAVQNDRDLTPEATRARIDELLGPQALEQQPEPGMTKPDVIREINRQQKLLALATPRALLRRM
jgi:hypothetical protein